MNNKHKDDIRSLFPLVSDARKKANINDLLSIDFNEMDPDRCYEEDIPLTPSGKIPKYRSTYHFAYYRDLPQSDKYGMPDINWKPGKEFFGEIKYLQDATIGQARLTFWTSKRELYDIEIKKKDNRLTVTKVTGSDRIILYKL